MLGQALTSTPKSETTGCELEIDQILGIDLDIGSILLYWKNI